jgi:hypothetical protein
VGIINNYSDASHNVSLPTTLQYDYKQTSYDVGNFMAFNISLVVV